MTLQDKIEKIVSIVNPQGAFDSDPETCVRLIFEAAAQLASEGDQRIATDSEVEDLLTVAQAEEIQRSKTLSEIAGAIAEALHGLRLVKSATSHEAIPLGLSDELWRLADNVQGHLEYALDKIDPKELEGWLNSTW